MPITLERDVTLTGKATFELSDIEVDKIATEAGYIKKPDIEEPPKPPITGGFNFEYELKDVNRPDVGCYTNNGFGAKTDPDAKEFKVYRFAFHLPHNRDLNASDIAGYKETLLKGLSEGKKGYIRFIYNYDRVVNQPILEQMLRHIAQLGAFLHEMRHAIAAVDFAFLGLWGEYHSDNLTAENVRNANAMKQRQAMEAHWPKDMSIQVRYPKVLIRQGINPTGWFDWDKPLNATTAYDATKTTWGGHGDSWGNLPQESTWWPHDRIDGEEWRQQKAFMWANAQWSYYSGEPVPVGYKSPWDVSNYKPMTRQGVIDHIFRTGTSLLNSNGNAKLKEYMQQEAAMYLKYKNTIGYNLWLNSLKISNGSSLKIDMAWSNAGSSGKHNPRPLILRVAGKDVVIYEDVRKYVPRGQKSGTISVELPKLDLATGTHPIAIWLPDPHKDLRNKPEFAVQLTNKGVTFNGANDLGVFLTV